MAKAGKEAKVWLHDMSVAVNLGYNARELNEIVRKVRETMPFWRCGMTTLVVEIEDSRPVEVSCDDQHLHVTLADGRALRTPLWWYPRLVTAPPRERAVAELMPMGIHWPEIDEDISVASMLRGQKAPGAWAPEGLSS